MFEHKKILSFDDYFVELNLRREKGVYFYRINGFNQYIKEFIIKYYDEARKSGVIIEGKIPNPDDNNLRFYDEIMGSSFEMSSEFIMTSLKKWLPRMNDYQRNTVGSSIFDSLSNMRNEGKTDNMLKNAYIKFMCWLYYKFERIVNRLGENVVPKILYEGEISKYELMLISILSNAGCDVVLIQYKGDEPYKKLDALSKLSDNLIVQNMTAFPQDFNLKAVRNEIVERANNERLYGEKPSVINCTNAWISGKWQDDIKNNFINRGNDPKLYYNCLYRVHGVPDKLLFANDLYKFQLELKSNKRRLAIIDKEGIVAPSPDEIAKINRKNYGQTSQMIMDLSDNFKTIANQELRKIITKAFVDIILEESKLADMNLNKLTSKAIYIICWLKRYYQDLFSCWKLPEISCLIYLGGCKNANEELFIRFIARLPVDVLIIVPNLNSSCCLKDKVLYEVTYEDSMELNKFPRDSGSNLNIGTAAYHAERDLVQNLYQDTGMYRNKQYNKAIAVKLRTMYEELAIIWDKELRYRPNFSTIDDRVNMPVIFSKVSGVKNNDLSKYWSGIKSLLTEDTILIKDVPFIEHNSPNPVKLYVNDFFKNGKLQRNRIKESKGYQYGFIREEMQEHMLDKLEIMIEDRMIAGIFENGMEYTVIATVLNINKEWLRRIQKFDFTKKNPKIIYINTTENIISIEDSILMVFLNLIGFDVLFFVPTGYQSVENHIKRDLLEEHQIGEYVYDLRVPNFDEIPSNNRQQGWREKIFKRGNKDGY